MQHLQVCDKCSVCGTLDPKGKHNIFVVDHSNYTGRVRGLLCYHCNTGVGKLGGAIEGLERSLQYLKENDDGSTK